MNRTEQKRSHILAKVSTPKLGITILLSVLLILSIVSAAAQGINSETREGPTSGERVLRYERTLEGYVIDILPKFDAYVTSNWPNNNYGLTTDFWVGYDLDRSAGGVQRSFLMWEGADFPPNMIINSAELWFSLNNSSPSGDAAMETELRHLLQSWDETTINWNNAADIDWASISTQGQISEQQGWQALDATALVKEWMSGAHANNGLVLLGDERVQQRERGILSKDSSSIDTRPILRINFTLTLDSTPPTATMVPFPQPIIGQSQFDVSWTGADESGGSGIDFFDVQYDADGDSFGWVNWQLHTTGTTASFTGDSTKYQFRVRATDKAGNLSAWSSPEEITVDTMPPNSTVLPFDPPIVYTTTIQVEWSGDDGPNGSGIQSFNVYTRQGNGGWVSWLSQTTVTSATFTATTDASYSFEATAVDNLGNVELFTGNPEASVIVDIDPPFLETASYLPLISKNGS